MPGKSIFRKRSQILLAFALFITAAACLVLFGKTLLQEGNPVPVIAAVAELENSGEQIVPLQGEGNKLLQKKGAEDPLSDYLAEQGWRLRERLGSSIFYEKGETVLSVEARMFTRRYVVYELNQEP